MQQDRDRFDKYTGRARKILSLAHEEAQRLQHNYIGSEHLLLGILLEIEGIGGRALIFQGLSPFKVRDVVIEQVGKGDRIALGEIGLTSHAKTALEQAVDEAQALNHPYISSEHLLLGLIHDENTATRVLDTFGVDRDKLREQVIQLIKLTPGTIAPPAPATCAKPLRQEHFAKFTENARQALSLAQDEAQRLQHNYIGTEHLLLGLVALEKGTAREVLDSLDVEPRKVQSSIEFIIGRSNHTVQGQIGLTPRAKKVIELAVDEASLLHHEYIGTEHLLLGLVREGEGIAAGVLESLDVKLEDVRRKTQRILAQSAGKEPNQATRQEGPAQEDMQPQTPLSFASLYARGLRPDEQKISSIQDADDLLPVSSDATEPGNRLSLRLRRVLVHAYEEKQRQQSTLVGTHHLLLALLREQNGLAFHVLQNFHIEHESIQKTVELLQELEHANEPGEINGFTIDGWQALEMAQDEALQLGQTTIGVEHLLLALLHSDGLAAGLLTKPIPTEHDLTLENARLEIRRLLNL